MKITFQEILLRTFSVALILFTTAFSQMTYAGNADSLLMLTEELQGRAERAEIHHQLSVHYLNHEQFRLATDHALQAKALLSADSASPAYTKNLITLSGINLRLRQLNKAYHYASEAYHISGENGYHLLHATAAHNISLILKETGKNREAINYALEALRMFGTAKDSLWVSYAHNNLGMIWKNLGDFEKARAYYDTSLLLRNTYGTISDRLNALGNMANLYKLAGNYEQAFRLFQETQVLAQESGSSFFIANNYFNLGELMCLKGDTTAALVYLDSCIRLAAVGQFTELLRDGYKMLADINQAQNNYQLALEYYQKFNGWNDSLIAADNIHSITEMQLLDEARNRRNQIKKLELQNLRNNRIFHLVLIFLLAVIILLIHLRYIKIKRTKFALREREKKFRMLAENAAEVIWSSDLNLNLTYISPSAEKIFGYPRQERMGKLMSDVFSSSSVQQMHSLLNQQLARIQTNKHKAEPLTIELKGFHINGREVWVEVTASLIFDHNGRPSGLQGTAREISRRKETELKMTRMLEDMNRQDKELREQNAALLLARKEYEEVADKYYDLFENGPVGYVILDEQGLVTGLNSAASMMVGHNSDEVRSKPFSEFVHQHQRTQFSSLLNDTLGSRQVNQQEFEISDITAKMVFVPDTIGGSKKCRLALVDVTGEVKVREELSLALQSMKTVFDAIPAGITVVDKDYRVVNMNKWLQDIHHFEKQSDYLGKKCFEIFNCGKRPCSGCIWGQVYQTRKTIIRNSSPDDPVYKKGQFRIYSSPMFDRSGRIIGIVEMVMDISDLKKAESALKDSERKFKELFNDIPDAVFITGIGDESGKIIDVNPAAELQTGYSREELLTMNVLTDISEYNEDNNMTADREQQLISDNKIKLTERKQRKDGSFIWSEVVVQKIVIDGKKHALSVSRDISERVRIQEHLKESEARIRSLLSAIPDILFVFDREGHFLEYHSDTDDKLIMPPERFLNRKVNEILPDQLANLTKKKIEETFSTGRMQMYEYDIDAPDGKNYFDVRMVKASEDTVLTIVRDITLARRAEKDKKQNEEKFKTLFLNTPLGVFNFNENSVILNCNANFEKIIGSDSNVLIGFNILKQSKDNELKQAVFGAIKNGTGYYEGNYRSVTSGKITPVKAFFKSIYDHHGSFVDGIGIVEDVTEQKKYEANLLKALKRAEQSDRLKSSFMATMSHELRTPLNTVIGFSDMIEEDMPIDQVLEFTQVISKSGRYLLSIIEDILDISLIDSGEAKMLVERFMISDLMNRLYNDASREKVLLNKDHLSIKVKYPDSMQDIKLSGDIRKIKKVFLHLIRNALKFTKKGEIEIGARPVSESDANGEVLFYVKDTGIGIPDEKHDLIFEIFRQGDDSRTREFEGTGLGLSISRKLIHLMGGTIHLESEPGKGSTFSFQLPVRAGAAKDVNARPGNIKPELKITTGITVLVAEDDDTNFHLFRLLLNRKKLEVIRAKNGEEALKEVSQNKDIALVLMDINMPVMNGYEATRQIKKLREDLPVIAVTAYAMTGDRIMAEEAGCDDYITKPINNTIFYETIEKYLI